MTEPTQLPFVLNQAQIDAAIAHELLKPSKEGLKIDYTSGRPPRGLTGAITVSEELIRRAVIAHARKLVNPMFTHFSVEFVATRGEDGITANIIASNIELAPEEPAPAPVTRQARVTLAPAAQPTTAAAEEVAPAATVEEVEVAPAEVEPGETAPWEDDGSGEAQAVSTEEVVEQAADVDEAEKPAPTPRARLFADLKRPSNDPAE